MAPIAYAYHAAALCDMVEDYFGKSEGWSILHANGGYRWFLNALDTRLAPPRRHVWTFMEPAAFLALPAEVGGTASGVHDGGTITVTATAGDLHTGAGFQPFHVGELLQGTGLAADPMIERWISPTQVSFTGDAGSEFTDETINVPHPGVIDLPESFGGLVEKPVYIYDTAYARPQFEQVSPEAIFIIHRRSKTFGTPRFYALMAKPFTAATGQRWQIMFAPRTDVDRVVRLRYRVQPAVLTDAADVFPLGGPDHFETIKWAALAHAEYWLAHAPGVCNGRFQELLWASIDADMVLYETDRAQK